MTVAWLLALYVLVGVVCGALGFERSRTRGVTRVLAALVTIVIWPLWAPFVLLGDWRK